ncbi:MAG: type II secretion system F family protein [Nitrospirae bacterium]|nr:MAG: type II secretion system F family protein [Nitrospirota bacterium]
MDFLLLGGSLGILACLFFILLAFVLSSRQRARQWLNRLSTGTSRLHEHGVASMNLGTSSTVRRLLEILQRVGQSAQPKDPRELSKVQSLLTVAGYRRPQAPVIFWGARIVTGGTAAFCMAFLPLPRAGEGGVLQVLFMIVLAAFLGLYLPNLWLRVRAQYRQRQFRDGFPDVLDLLVVCVEAGLGLDAAISRVGTEIRLSYPVISEEFGLLSLHLRMGVTREEALRRLGARVELREVKQLISLLVQTERLGSSVGKALRVHADSMRKKRFFRAEELAAKLPVKLTFPLILFIFPALFIVLLGPAGIQVSETLLPALGGGR